MKAIRDYVNREGNKPVISTMINTCALALTSYGVFEITTKDAWMGYIPIAFGFGLEWFKYWGMSKGLW